MSPASVQFLKVLALFFVQGQLIWLLSFWRTYAVTESWALALFGAIVAWWPLWFALHRERTWRPCLETMLLMGATFWLPLFSDHWVRSLWPSRESFLFPPEAILYLMLFYAIVFTPVAAVFWFVIRKLTRWQWQSDYAVTVHLRDFFLIMAAAAIHVMGFAPTIQHAIERGVPSMENDDWSNILNSSLFLAALLTSLSILVFGAACVVMGDRMKRNGVIFIVLGVLALGTTTGLNQTTWDRTFFSNLAIAVATILLQAFLTALALRWFGYRLGKQAGPGKVQNGSMISPSARLPN